MSLEQIIVLAIIQGISEFLPISSSGHLILIPAITGWPDQGLEIDVMVHVGSLFAIIAYFHRDVRRLMLGAVDLIRWRLSDNARLALMIVLATIPAVLFALLLKSTGFLDRIRGAEIVGWNAIIFGILLYVSDRFSPHIRTLADMRLGRAMIIGIAQAMALIPGTSRSGITITAARAMGFERSESARFSFLLGMPAIAGAGLLTALEFFESGQGLPPGALLAAALSFLASLGAIAFLMALIKRMSFLPFVLYRLALGLVLLGWVYL
ncbi:MAG: undecaprenyl-diphosphate phosphatase [Hyphomicrobiales bacterium]|nr:MAG: undecaprenyl-diphosphate phosphatase [Hyphomicrobiales bacterium]